MFSVLKLAEEDCDVTVDYSMPLVRLAFQVLNASEYNLCLCEIRLVNQKLRTQSEKFYFSTSCDYVEWDASPYGSIFKIREKIKVAREDASLFKIANDGIGRNRRKGERTV